MVVDYHLTSTVFAAIIFQLLTHSAALMEPFLPSDTITYVTLPHHFCLKSVMMLRLDTISSHLLGKLLRKLLDTGQQLVVMMPVLIFVLQVFGVIVSNMMYVFLIL